MQLDENGKTAAHCSGRIAYQSSSERTQERRWVEVYAVIDHLMSIAGGETALTHMMVDALGRGLAPMGHGGKAARALGKKDDILAALQGNPNLRACWTRRAFPGSKFLTSLCRTYSALGMQQELDQLYAALPVLQSFATGFRAAMQMRPGPDDYRLVAEELPRFAVEKARLWPGKLRWYDNHCLYHLPYMMRKWGSLGLISQQGMEGWQKMLNEVLRLGNGFANAGRIPRIVLRAGEARRAQYLLRRAAKDLRKYAIHSSHT